MDKLERFFLRMLEQIHLGIPYKIPLDIWKKIFPEFVKSISSNSAKSYLASKVFFFRITGSILLGFQKECFPEFIQTFFLIHLLFCLVIQKNSSILQRIPTSIWRDFLLDSEKNSYLLSRVQFIPKFWKYFSRNSKKIASLIRWEFIEILGRIFFPVFGVKACWNSVIIWDFCWVS